MLQGNELPPGPCFIYGNHCNNYDPFILNAFTCLGQATAGVMTKEYLHSGPLAKLFSWTGIVGTEKRVPEPHLIRKIWKMLDEGRRVVIFPEGGRRWDGRPAPWIQSTARLFMKAGAPVYPVEIIGSYVGWPRWAQWPRPAHIKLKVHAALDFSDSPVFEEGLRRLKRPISTDENKVSGDISPAWAFRPAAGIDRLLYRDMSSGVFSGLKVVSGKYLLSESGDHKWRVNSDSTLTDLSSGTTHTSAYLYDQVRSLPLPDDRTKAITSTRGNVVFNVDHLEHQQPAMRCSLWHDRIELDERVLPLEEIRYMGLERSDRIWFLTSMEKIQMEFGSASVLAWYDVLEKLAPHINS